MRRLSTRALLLAVPALLIWSAAVSGHAELRSAEPGPGDVVEQLPGRLIARFTQELKKDRTSIELRDADGQTIARGGKVPDRARVQRIELPQLEAGRYEVRWVTFSAEDNELARGRYRFTVTEAAAAAASSPEASVQPCPSTAPLDPATASAAPSASPEPSTEPDTADSTEPDPSPAPEADSSPAPCPTVDAEPMPSPSADPSDESVEASPRP